ncbi:MAG: glycosyltransferase [Bacteroidota bacterium]
MKVLIILVPRFDPNSGGVQMSTFKLASYFHSQQVPVSVFSFDHQGHQPPDFLTSFDHGQEPGVNYKAANMERCREFVRQEQPDVVINQMPYELRVGDMLKAEQATQNFLLLGCLRGSFFAVKLNLELYRKTLLPKPLQPFFKHQLGYWMLLQVHKFKHGRDLKHIIDTYNYYVLFGDPNRKELEYFIGAYKQHKLAYIPNSIPQVLDEVPTKEKRLLWLSRVDYRQKHAEYIIPLWKKLKDRLPDWEFDVVGNGGALPDLKQQAQEEQIERIHFYGKQKPDSYYSRAPIYIMTSSFEGFPNTLIEAQSFGAVPIVFDSYPMVREIVNSENGVLVETHKLDQMADEIVRLADDSGRNQNMMTSALENARRFTIDQVGQKWIDLFASHSGQ